MSRVSSESSARLGVRLLGAVEVILDGRRLGAFNSLRLQRFLALITLRPDLQHRSRLAFELWPDSDERQARTNLRKLLHDFRHSLPDIGEFVQVDNEIVRWIPTGSSEVDVLRFRDAIAVYMPRPRGAGRKLPRRRSPPRAHRPRNVRGPISERPVDLDRGSPIVVGTC
jgi:DNA-binding SARP family transcriptional activator